VGVKSSVEKKTISQISQNEIFPTKF